MGSSYKCYCNEGYTLARDERSCLCGGTLTESSGSFQTPGWPLSYPQKDIRCEWIIRLPNASQQIEYTIESPYGIDGEPPCFSDYIEFHDGVRRGSVSLQKLCKFSNPGPVISSASHARVVFMGSFNLQRPSNRVGVKVSYRSV